LLKLEISHPLYHNDPNGINNNKSVREILNITKKKNFLF
jgi:hypothetical protein